MFWETQPSHNLLYGAGVRFIYEIYWLGIVLLGG